MIAVYQLCNVLYMTCPFSSKHVQVPIGATPYATRTAQWHVQCMRTTALRKVVQPTALWSCNSCLRMNIDRP